MLTNSLTAVKNIFVVVLVIFQIQEHMAQNKKMLCLKVILYLPQIKERRFDELGNAIEVLLLVERSLECCNF